MSDFHQAGQITALHRLGEAPLGRLEAELKHLARDRPMTLVLPCLYTEIRGAACGGIAEVLRAVPYLQRVVVSVSGTADRDEFLAVRNFFDSVPGAVCLWSSGPTIGELLRALETQGLAAGPDGKGRAVWIGMGYALAHSDTHGLVFHDCDILTYTPELLARLCFPVVHPHMDYQFAKGYYGRATDRLHGRVTRLFCVPLVRSLMQTLGRLPLLEFMDSFRYPLAGEFAMDIGLARQVRIPSDWGLEVGLLAEVYRNASRQRVCQVELCDRYDHRHRELSRGDSSQGLHRMVIDIATSLFRNLASVGVQFDAGFLNTLCATYLREAQQTVTAYADDALINGLLFDQHDEEVMVETFAAALRAAGFRFVGDPFGVPAIPNWHRVIAARADILAELSCAAELDRAR
jgi:glucosyl-3-phosphoglycerate synthase